ncbi:MAG: tRNA uridine-5-carboxymethylaminomethyl(34) synthesis enzyme MnmG [Firmicutes bacterium]|nr:tRNA uridine-5-carboxymethylaminomethyl(34) synthesis enzyme MnmG [Bacillota bacterium]
MAQTKTYDVIVVGAGHAGCEAAYATAKMGFRTLLLTLNFSNIAFMPCNPSVGGPGKGHLVREVDALGGLIGRVTDLTHLQMRSLNTQKGPAVRALRAQVDKRRYQEIMLSIMEKEPLISLRQGEIVDLQQSKGTAASWRLQLSTGIILEAPVVILAAGTFLRGTVHIGLTTFPSGPQGQHPSISLPEKLAEMGVRFRRFKTGTSARLRRRSLNFEAMKEQPGEETPHGFSFWIPWKPRLQASCWLTYTNERTHEIIRKNLHLAPMYCGAIKGVGTRYCPAIEGKVVNFPDRPRHQVFIEPESAGTDEVYVAGLSSSLPEEIQEEFIRTVPGLEKAEIVRPGYAIEYDVVAAEQLTPYLQLKEFPGFFCAGQINGTSGYEEAAAQGIMAGINAGLYLKGKKPFLPRRDEAYIGVLLDDLITKELDEPYRIMTSFAEFRLSLRQENADLRLAEYGYRYGLLSEAEYEHFLAKKERIQQIQTTLEKTAFDPRSAAGRKVTEQTGITLQQRISLAELLQKPEVSYKMLQEVYAELPPANDEARVVENQIKYQGYLAREAKMAERLRKMEEKQIPPGFDYNEVPNLSTAAREKLTRIAPLTLGQAGRISGVGPADLSALLIWLEARMKR